MNWKNQPATSAQLTLIRDLYCYAIGWDRAMAKVHTLKDAGITKGEASKEIDRLQDLKAKGQLLGNEI